MLSMNAHDGIIGIIEVSLYVLGSGGAALAAAMVTARHAKAANAPARTQIAELVASVSNGHSTPIREDIDDIRAAVHDIRTDQAELRADIRELREEIRIERDDIVELQSRVANLTPPPVRRRVKKDPA